MDERDYVMEDLFEAGNLLAGGYVRWVHARDRHLHSLTGDPYFTDGRAVVIILGAPLPKILDWS